MKVVRLNESAQRRSWRNDPEVSLSVQLVGRLEMEFTGGRSYVVHEKTYHLY
jgi:hypothetical protein